MKNRKQQNFYLYFILENSNYNFLYMVRNCKRPEQTKEYKRLQSYLYRNIVKSIGWCDQGYFEDYRPKFVNPGETYLQIN